MKKAFALILSALMLLSSVPTYAIEIETPEAAIETAELSGDAELSGTATAFTEPTTGDYGKLVYAIDFESGAMGDYSYDADYASPYAQSGKTFANAAWSAWSGTYSIVDAPAGRTGKVLKMADTTAFGIFSIDLPNLLFSKPGKYTVTFDAYHDGSASLIANHGLYVNGTGSRPDTGISAGTTGWNSNAKSYVIRNQEQVEYEFGKDKSAYSYTTSTVSSENSPVFYGHSYYIFTHSGSAQRTMYIDNVKIWYEEYADITFHLDTDTAVTSDIAAASMPLSHRTLKPGAALPTDIVVGGAGKEFVGWKDADDAPVTTAAAGKYDLYAVYEDTDAFEVSVVGSDFVKAGSGASYQVNATQPTDWTIDLGNTDAVIAVENAGTVRINVGSRAGIVTINGVCKADDSKTVTKTLTIHSSKVQTPGLNLYTGTLDGVTFDNGNQSRVGGPGSDMVEVDGRTAIDYEPYSGYNSIALNVPQEAGRLYNISYDRKVMKPSGVESPSYTSQIWWTNNGNLSPNTVTGTFEAWGVVTYSGKRASSSDNHFQINNKTNGQEKPAHIYFDNINVTPWYKINYHMADDTVASVDCDPTAASYTVDTAKTCADYGADGKYYTFAGWAETADATAAVSEVALKYSDVDLYPVFDVIDYTTLLTTSPADPMLIGNGSDHVDVVMDDSVTVSEWKVDLGNATDAKYAIDGNTVTVTAGNYSGVITVTAVLANGQTPGVTVPVVNGGKWKPGLNSYTGTTEPFGFESGKYGLSSLLGGSPNAWVRGENPAKNDVNSSDYAIYCIDRFSYIYPSNQFSPALEFDRPVTYTYKQLSNQGGYLMINQAGVQKYNLGSTSGAWKRFQFELSGNPYTNSGSVGAVKWIGLGPASASSVYGSGNYFYYDDISFIPFYKVTYVGENGTELSHTYTLWADTNNSVLLETYVPTGYDGFDYYVGSTKVNDGVKLANEDLVITVKAPADGIAYAGDTVAIVKPAGDTFTVPTLAESGITAANFISWTVDGVRVDPGTTVNTADYLGKSFIAFQQDASKSAMGIAFEGDSAKNVNAADPSGSNSFYTYVGYTQDEDRTVWKALYNKSGKNDARTTFAVKSGINPAEYSQFEYAFKVDSKKESKPNLRLFFQFNGCYWGAHTIGGLSYSGEYCIIDKNGYKYNDGYCAVSYDLSKSGATTVLWSNPNATFDAFLFDITNGDTDISQDTTVYVDYVRLYRSGINKVTYVLGNGEDDIVDNNRGVGTGYVLRTLYPTRDGFKFLGWSLTENGTTVETIDLTGDATVYAVWEPTEGPVSLDDKTEVADKTIDAADYNGVRFNAKITDELYNLNGAEFGYIVSRKVLLDKLGVDVDKFDTSIDSKYYVKGVAIDKANDIDKIRDVADNGDVTFSAFVYRNGAAIPDDEVMVARPYMLYGGKTLYGATMTYGTEATGKTLAELFAAVKGGFPTNPGDAWRDEDEIYAVWVYDDKLTLNGDAEIPLSSVAELVDGKYVFKTTLDGFDVDFSFSLTDGVLTGFDILVYYHGAVDNVISFTAPEVKTIAELLALASETFPTSADNAWVSEGGIAYVDNGELYIEDLTDTIPLTAYAKKEYSDYVYEIVIDPDTETYYHVYFIVDPGYLFGIIVDYIEDDEYVYEHVYMPVFKTVGSLIEGTAIGDYAFPDTEAKAWRDADGTPAYIKDGAMYIDNMPEDIPFDADITYKGNGKYEYIMTIKDDDYFLITFNVAEGLFESLEYQMYLNGTATDDKGVFTAPFSIVWEAQNSVEGGFPDNEDDAWVDENGKKAWYHPYDFYLGDLMIDDMGAVYYVDGNYVYTEEIDDTHYAEITFNMVDGHMVSINVKNYEDDALTSESTFKPASVGMTIGEILATAEKPFPTTEQTAWKSVDDATAFIQGDVLLVGEVEFGLTETAVCDNGDYVMKTEYEGYDVILTFHMENDKLVSFDAGMYLGDELVEGPYTFKYVPVTKTIAEILATVDGGFPVEENEECWWSELGYGTAIWEEEDVLTIANSWLYIDLDVVCTAVDANTFNCKGTELYSGYDYDYDITFNMTDGKLTSFDVVVLYAGEIDYEDTYDSKYVFNTIENIAKSADSYGKGVEWYTAGSSAKMVFDSYGDGNIYFEHETISKDFYSDYVYPKVGDNYVVDTEDLKVTFVMDNGKLVKAIFEAKAAKYEPLNGEYAPAPATKTVAEILATFEGGFPVGDEGDFWWSTDATSNICIYNAMNVLLIHDSIPVPLDTECTAVDANSYECEAKSYGYDIDVTFNLTDGKLVSIDVIISDEGTPVLECTYAPDVVVVDMDTVVKTAEGYADSVVWVATEGSNTLLINDRGHGDLDFVCGTDTEKIQPAFKNTGKNGNNYEYDGYDYKLTFVTNDAGNLVKVIFEATETEFEKFNGEYTAPTVTKTLAEILATAEGGFPTTEQSAWKYNSEFAYMNDSPALVVNHLPFALTGVAAGNGDIFMYTSTEQENLVANFTFVMENGKLVSIIYSSYFTVGYGSNGPYTLIPQSV